MTDTREALLDTAERLFAEAGIDAVSLREITSAAGANLASVHYHFGSKEGLVRDLYRRRLAPLNQERLRLLEEFEAGARSGTARLEEVVYAFIHPVVRLVAGSGDEGRHFLRLMGYAHADTNPALEQFVLEEMQPMVERFIEATARALPGVELTEIFWRAHFSTGALIHTVSCGRLLESFTGGACSLSDVDHVSRRLIAFIVGGMKADPSKLRIGQQGQRTAAVRR